MNTGRLTLRALEIVEWKLKQQMQGRFYDTVRIAELCTLRNKLAYRAEYNNYGRWGA